MFCLPKIAKIGEIGPDRKICEIGENSSKKLEGMNLLIFLNRCGGISDQFECCAKGNKKRERDVRVFFYFLSRIQIVI